MLKYCEEGSEGPEESTSAAHPRAEQRARAIFRPRKPVRRSPDAPVAVRRFRGAVAGTDHARDDGQYHHEDRLRQSQRAGRVPAHRRGGSAAGTGVPLPDDGRREFAALHCRSKTDGRRRFFGCSTVASVWTLRASLGNAGIVAPQRSPDRSLARGEQKLAPNSATVAYKRSETLPLEPTVETLRFAHR